MTRRALGATAVAVALLLLAACSGSDGADESALPDPGAPTIGIATNAALTASGDLETFDDGNGHAEVTAGGGYQIGLRTGQAVVTATLPRPFPRDQIVSAMFDTTASPGDVGFGVLCRLQDEDNYYRLGVSNDGEFAIQRVSGGKATVLTGDGRWQIDPALRSTPGPFSVRAECIDDTLTLFADNREVGSVTDATIRGRHAGVFVESFAAPNSVIKVRSLTVRAFADRSRVEETAVDGWDDLLRAERASRTCTLLNPKRSRAPNEALFATRCGPVVFVAMATPEDGARAYERVLKSTGAPLRTVRSLPDCPERTGIKGPLPTPSSVSADKRGAPVGTVACIDLGDTTGVVWLHALPGVIGVRRVSDADRAAWKGYGPDWAPFALVDPSAG